MTTTIKETRQADDLLTRISLLIGQSFFLGLTLGLLAVAAIALLISIYGSGALPYVYIVVAVLGSLAFYGFAEVQRRWSLVQVSTATELIIATFLALAWAGLLFLKINWLAFAAMVSFSLIMQVGFVIIGGQAGRLLDVRQIKRYFPRIVAGFVVGFLVSGVLVAPLQSWLGSTEYLLLAAAVSATAMLSVLLATNARYYRILAQATELGGTQIESPPLRRLLLKRFVILIFAYQMLSAVVSQLLDFMLLAAAGERFADSDALASFFGNFTIVVNLLNLLFLALVAGFLLSRFGLRFGLTANPAVDTLILVAIVVTGIVAGPTAALFFWLICLARILDITFTDGTTRTSINATFQALPANERVSVQTGVEGIGVPIALGLTGVVLLVFDALGEVTLWHVAIFTLFVSLLWITSALFVYRDYAKNLVRSMRRRALDPVELNLEDKANLEATNRLLASKKLSDVRLALDMLQGAFHPSLPGQLINLLQSDTPQIQTEALARIQRLQQHSALPTVENLAFVAGDPAVQGAAIRTYCALQEAEAVERVIPYLDSPHAAVRLGATVGLLRYGSIPGVLAVGQRLDAWEHSSDPADRCFLARVIGEVALMQVYQPLISLLDDSDLAVHKAALTAAGRVRHPRLLPQIASNLSWCKTRSFASDALVLYGNRMLPLVEKALAGDWVSEMDTVRLLRVCGQIKGEQVEALMRRNIDHSSDIVRDQVLAVLSACDFRAQTADLPALNRVLVRDVDYGHRIMIAQLDVGRSEPVEPLQRALSDDLMQVKRRVFWILSFIYDSRSILRAQSQLTQGTSAQMALALEMLEVSISSDHSTLVFPLIDPKLQPTQRISLLNKRFNNESLHREQRLRALIQEGDQGWTRACAIFAATKLGAVGQLAAEDMVPMFETALVDSEPIVRETAEWGLFELAPERFSAHAKNLLADQDPQVARLAAELAQNSTTP